MRMWVAVLGAVIVLAAAEARGQTLVLEGAEYAGISMFRPFWDATVLLSPDAAQKIVDSVITDRGGQAIWSADKPGPLAFDALNRMVLLRFPAAAEKIHAELAKGRSIARAEIILPYRDEELWPVGSADGFQPTGYSYRMNWGVDSLYRTRRPRWHAVAWALRRPWQADAKHGPTLNAAVNGAVYWSKYGAQDLETDRYAKQFGPAEVSYKNPEGRLDVTALLTDAAFGATAAHRLRQFADCGVLLKKWETYDHLFFQGVYEFATGCGGRAILIREPKLAITFAAGAALSEPLPKPADVVSLARKGDTVGSPTAVMPDLKQIEAWVAEFRRKPDWMSDWQWARVQELAELDDEGPRDQPYFLQYLPKHLLGKMRETVADPAGKKKKGIPGPVKLDVAYATWVDQLIARQPRGWAGFEIAREMSQWYMYGKTLPGPAQEAIRRYWEAWLMPDRVTAATDRQRVDFNDVSGDLIHPMADDPRIGRDAQGRPPTTRPRGRDPAIGPEGLLDTYYAKTGDWRGNKSFFRSGFTYMTSTQNFNTTATTGALLAGGLIGSERAMADGRNGLEAFLMRQWAWGGGSSQEHLDHYYFAVTVSGTKAIADFAATYYDRLAARGVLAKYIEELVSAYHPGLRHFLAGASRTSLEYVLATQDGLQFILHTLSRQGTVRELGGGALPGNMSRFGHEVRPKVVFQQSLSGPWAPEWVAEQVDGKPLPYYAVHRGGGDGAVWRKCWLGRNYGLASSDTGTGRLHLLGHWRRKPQTVSGVAEIGTMDLRYGFNDTQWVNSGPGYIFHPGSESILQHQNKMIVITSPRAGKVGFLGTGACKELWSLQTSVGLFNYQPSPTWEFYSDGRKVQVPYTGSLKSRITVKDGASYLAFVPLPGTDLGRDVELEIVAGKPQRWGTAKTELGPAVVINAYNFKKAKPVSETDPLWQKVPAAWGGFLVEMGDESEYGSFEAFQKHIDAVVLNAQYDPQTQVVTVNARSGQDELKAASCVWIPNPNVEDGKEPRETGAPNLSVREVNGRSDLPPSNILRDTPYCQEGFGALEKNGARFEGNPRRHLFLLTEPKQGVFCAWNPLPDLTPLKFTLPTGLIVESDGAAGLSCITVSEGGRRVEIESAFKAGQEMDASAARRFIIRGPVEPQAIKCNGAVVQPLAITLDGQKAWAVPMAAVGAREDRP